MYSVNGNVRLERDYDPVRSKWPANSHQQMRERSPKSPAECRATRDLPRIYVGPLTGPMNACRQRAGFRTIAIHYSYRKSQDFPKMCDRRICTVANRYVKSFHDVKLRTSPTNTDLNTPPRQGVYIPHESCIYFYMTCSCREA